MPRTISEGITDTSPATEDARRQVRLNSQYPIANNRIDKIRLPLIIRNRPVMDLIDNASDPSDVREQ